MKRLPAFAISIFVLVLAFAGHAQQFPNQQQNPLIPTITFDRLWEAATPQDFTISVQSSGSARYLSRNPTAPAPPPNSGIDNARLDPDYSLEFTMSAATRDRIFKLAQEANYFNGQFDYKHKVANTGQKTLTYADPTRHFQTSYNWSTDKAIDELTHIFQSISNTVEHGRKLQFLRRYDKLGLDTELKYMEEECENHGLAEMELIAPILQKLADDPAVLHIAQQRARHLLKQASAGAGSR